MKPGRLSPEAGPLEPLPARPALPPLERPGVGGPQREPSRLASLAAHRRADHSVREERRQPAPAPSAQRALEVDATLRAAPRLRGVRPRQLPVADPRPPHAAPASAALARAARRAGLRERGTPRQSGCDELRVDAGHGPSALAATSGRHSSGFYSEKNTSGAGHEVRTPCHTDRAATFCDARAR